MYAHSYCRGRGLCFLALSGRARKYIHILAYKYAYIHKYIKIKTHRHIKMDTHILKKSSHSSNSNSYLQSFFLLFHIPYLYVPSPTEKILVPKNIICINLLSLISKIVSECLYQYYYNKQNRREKMAAE